MCFIDYTFFPILFFLGWNIVTAKQFMPNIYRYGFVRDEENKDSFMSFQQTKLSENDLLNETQTNSNFLDLFQTSFKLPLNNTEIDSAASQENNKSYSYSSEIELLLNFYRLTGKYKDSSYRLSSTNSILKHIRNRNNKKLANLPVNSLKSFRPRFKNSQNIQGSFGSKTFLNQISLFYLKKTSGSIFKNAMFSSTAPGRLNCYNKFTGMSYKIDNNLFQKISYNPNFNKRLSFFMQRRDAKKINTQQKNQTFYFSNHRFNKFNSLVQKFDVSLINHKIQKRREKKIQLLLQTPIQKIYSLQQFQIPLYFSSAI